MAKKNHAHPRKRGRMMARYGLGGLDKTAFTMNVSLDGAYIKTNSVFKPGTTIQVEIGFPSGKYALWAQVIWAKRVPAELAHVLPCGMGLRFINPGADWPEVFSRWERG